MAESNFENKTTQFHSLSETVRLFIDYFEVRRESHAWWAKVGKLLPTFRHVTIALPFPNRSNHSPLHSLSLLHCEKPDQFSNDGHHLTHTHAHNSGVMSSIFNLVVVTSAFLVVGTQSGPPTVDGFPANFKVQILSSAFKLPIGMVWIDDKRALILEKKGQVFIANPNAPGFPKQPYMQVRFSPCVCLLVCTVYSIARPRCNG
jgi:hypothetical protein